MAGLEDAEITVALASMVHRKIKATETKMEFPVSPDPLIKKNWTHNPVKKIFNIMSYSVELRWKKNLEGYACPDSASGALKIWYIADA